jgi:hypothetical protein
MKALSVVLILVVAIGFGIVGCTDNAEPVVALDNQAEILNLERGWAQ